MDLYIVQLQDSLPLTSVQSYPKTDSTPRQLSLVGRGFHRAVEVLVNGRSVTDFSVVRANTLLVNLPDILADVLITTVEVYSDTIHDLQSSRLVWRLGTGGRVLGPQKAIQLFMKWLFTTRGSDVIRREVGGGWKQLLSSTTGSASLAAGLSDGLNNVLSYLHQIYARQPSTPLDEQIVGAELVSVIETERRLQISVRVLFANGVVKKLGVM